MAINKNHEFEDLDGVKCAVVEKEVSPERVEFLKKLLEYNRFTVVVVKTPPPKVVAKPVPPPPAADAAVSAPVAPPPAPEPPPGPETFTVGVTDVAFNSTNAVFGRQLKAKDGRIVSLAYWEQKEKESNEDIPYYENENS